MNKKKPRKEIILLSVKDKVDKINIEVWVVYCLPGVYILVMMVVNDWSCLLVLILLWTVTRLDKNQSRWKGKPAPYQNSSMTISRHKNLQDSPHSFCNKLHEYPYLCCFYHVLILIFFWFSRVYVVLIFVIFPNKLLFFQYIFFFSIWLENFQCQHLNFFLNFGNEELSLFYMDIFNPISSS